MASVIIFQNVCKSFEQHRVTALDNVSVEIPEGKISVLVGRSGSGKSTFLNTAGGLLKPDSGKVFFEDRDLYAMRDGELADIRSREICTIYQSFNLINELTVLENIRLPFDISGDDYEKEREAEVIEMLGLSERLNFYPAKLSGGERQRAAAARALIRRPKVILADEPNGSIDSAAGQRMMEYFRESNQRFGQTFVIVTHDFEWLKYADCFFKMEDGQIRPFEGA